MRIDNADQRHPYILEFTGLEECIEFSESELESRLLDHLQEFLLELGKGFAFVGRQMRFTFDEEHFRVDLVFYNRLLRCFVLFDLKIGKLTHQDLGQMQMYVNYYDRYEKTADENPTIGVLLCQQKSDALVELTLPADSNIYASKYLSLRLGTTSMIIPAVWKSTKTALWSSRSMGGMIRWSS